MNMAPWTSTSIATAAAQLTVDKSASYILAIRRNCKFSLWHLQDPLCLFGVGMPIGGCNVEPVLTESC